MNPTHEDSSTPLSAPEDISTNPADRQSSAAPPAKRTPGVFLHTGWRSAGTWVWSRFRSMESVSAFYEPLSTLVGELSLAAISELRPAYSSGHPTLHTPYFEEYRRFLQINGRGVDGYRKSFAIDRFGDEPGDDFPALSSYLHNLCVRSTQQGKVPVLKFCRSQGRTPWLKRAFPDLTHAGVLRNPASQFASAWLLRQEWHNPFFVAAPFRVLGLSQNDPLVRQAIVMCGVKLPPVTSAQADAYAAACDHYAQTVEGSDAYRAFVALWILCAWRMLNNVDLLLDADQLGQSPAYAAEMSAQFRVHTGITPDLSGAKNLVDEATRNVQRISGIDGRLLRPINFSVEKFLRARIEASDGSKTAIADKIRQKLSLANDLSEQWRY